MASIPTGLNFTVEQYNEFFFSLSFHYHPSVALAGTAVGLFGLLAIVGFALTCKYGEGYMFLLPIMNTMVCIGYIIRIVTESSPDLGKFMASTILILLAPTFLNLINYIYMGKLLTVAGKNVSFGHPRLTIRAEKFGRSFFILNYSGQIPQAVGAGLMIAGPDTTDAGKILLQVGLVVQLVVALLFMTVVFRVTTHRYNYGLSKVPSLRPMFICLYTTVALLFLRSVYRLVSFVSAPNGPAYTTEWVFYVFDSLLILSSFFVFYIFHYGRILELKSDKPKWIEEFKEINKGNTVVSGAQSSAIAPALDEKV
jgi:hypothetical protein